MAVHVLALGDDEPAADLDVEVTRTRGEAEEGLVDSLPFGVVGGVHGQ